MDVILLVISVLLITVVLLQSGKAESAGNILMGGNAELFAQRKERGSELFLSRLTLILGLLFFVICLVLSLI
ncbi:MAG: preprotein translocase subunit SecG [Bacilli bacterium]|nr:preprotein translocase subunit SecG [Bacilli bacterium]